MSDVPDRPATPRVSNEELSNAMSAVGQRRLIGYLGILLPLLCFGYTLIFEKGALPTISHYYYSPIHGPFIAILCGLGMVLYVYRGYDHWDNNATNFAAFAAFGVGLFPTARGDEVWLPELTFLCLNKSEKLNGYVHDGSAISLFLMFFFISGFLFTRKAPSPGEAPTFPEFWNALKKTWLFAKTPLCRKGDPLEKENIAHRRCAWIILVSILLVVATSQKEVLAHLPPWPWMAVFESTAIIGFAYSWLVKNRNDPNVVKVIAGDLGRVARNKTKTARPS